ncbi:RloB family protein [Leuconostoc mesenteroides]|uniref:RloB family protein n=1 Tax=Leuconostoc mesenteroides TaxID=1245 RepID=UPI002113EBBA|nr:RloB family protein [Leuconostoc mesenteroides]UUE17032.1 RloB family protein [Leuconostoc mesenteroides]
MARISQKRPLLNKILIFVEGPTESNYFEQLRQNKNISNATVVKILNGQGDYVDKAEQQIKSFKKSFEINRKILVFDANHQSNSNLQKLITKAKSKGYEVAFSNTCFEVWLLSHFEKMTTGVIEEKKLCKKITLHLKTKYKKADTNQLATIMSHINNAFTNTATINQVSFTRQSTNVGDIISTL